MRSIRISNKFLLRSDQMTRAMVRSEPISHKPFDFAANQSEQLTRDLSRRGA